jgi:hypothetical protein
MIRGRPYHPQTQGSVGIANRTFKQQLWGVQLSYGHSGNQWVELLPQLQISRTFDLYVRKEKAAQLTRALTIQEAGKEAGNAARNASNAKRKGKRKANYITGTGELDPSPRRLRNRAL